MKNRFNFEVTEILQKFLNIYLNPNMRKNPTKSFFIITAPKCSVKPLSKVVTALLKLLFNHIKHYNFKSQCYSGVKTFCSLQNNQNVINTINNLNSRNKAVSHI